MSLLLGEKREMKIEILFCLNLNAKICQLKNIYTFDSRKLYLKQMKGFFKR